MLEPAPEAGPSEIVFPEFPVEVLSPLASMKPE